MIIPKEVQQFILPINKLIFNKHIQDMCMCKYPGHPRGCPNYGKKEKCPPQAKLIDQILDINKPMFFVIEEFDLQSHINRMKDKHPNWSDRQSRCCLYWQKTPRKNLIPKVKIVMNLLGLNTVSFLPEANGVNVYATAFHSGLRLEKIKELKTHRQIAIIGYKI